MKINNVLCFIDYDGIKEVEFHDTTPITLEFGNDKVIGFATFTVKESGVYADIEIDPKHDIRVAANNKLYPYLSGITEYKKPLKITGMALGVMPNVDSRIPAIHSHQIETYA